MKFGEVRITESNIGALVIKIGFGGPLCYKYNKEPQTSIGTYKSPYIRAFLLLVALAMLRVVSFRSCFTM